ncbi:P-loop containing nucleoside triphosphate hydrolase protein [Dendrothele bispora CBS 962.96]|uniref:P-loop containing nucleoside triphosphate hydrolase protein n=1 Tax=Dendrothele bispora (strain CBS 962.96) TaxID=1314807 RepID=A0A4S8KU05_DENBC|nr:P-loop containing nucleoside triphosphate hydrolase protein [Dendrothele bispora CBS 962.96]
MSSYHQHLQTIFSRLQNATQSFETNGTASSAPNPIVDAASQTLPPELSSMVSLFFSVVSISSLGDWLKLLFIGGFFETCRRLFFWIYSSVTERFYMKASFDSSDPSYEWMMVWLSKQPAWAKTRDVEISTETYGTNNAAVLLEDDDDTGLARFDYKTTRKLTYIPSPSKTYTLWYRGRYMSITRTKEREVRYRETENTLCISIFTRDHKLLRQLLQEARRAYIAAQESALSIWTADTYNDWNRVASRAKRSLNSIVLDPGVKDMLLDDARDFLASKQWYNERGIPFRRGYLLYGAPGSGKTSLIHSIAGELELDIYIISISRIGLDDASLSTLVNCLPERCVALMEDIDAAFTNGLSRDFDEEDEDEAAVKKINEAQAPEPAIDVNQNANVNSNNGNKPGNGTGSRVTLSGLLNALDGIGAQEGRILFATTNKYASLDPALCRPGRMDLHIEFKLASKYQARGLFRQFYHPYEKFDEVMEEDEDEVDEELKGEKTKEKEEHSDSGYSSSGASTPVSESSKATLGSRVVSPGSKMEFSVRRIKTLSKRFAEAVPDRELSMASLQGYLMMYKTKPLDAVRNLGEWIEKERKVAAQRKKKGRGKGDKKVSEDGPKMEVKEVESTKEKKEGK